MGVRIFQRREYARLQLLDFRVQLLGDIMHGHLSLDQLWAARPVLGHASYRAPIKGLYMCGAGTHPGAGVPGVLSSARVLDSLVPHASELTPA